MEDATIPRDFSSVTPSARWMVLLKGYTDIPYAKAVAELLEYPNKYICDFKKGDFTFWAGTLGLESRYKSIDQLLNELSIPNILELASGYSFRCLDYVSQKEIHYIDTDLPEVMTSKTKMLESLIDGAVQPVGKLELLPLNVLDETNFHEIVGHFPPGEVVVVNEGLLTYLKPPEKEKFCSLIHDILMKRGGYWITGDIFLNHKNQKMGLQFTGKIKDFNEQHQTETNDFESFKEAEQFFKRMGFVIDKEAKIKYSEMIAFKYLIKSMTLRQLFRIKRSGKIQTTWRLKAV